MSMMNTLLCLHQIPFQIHNVSLSYPHLKTHTQTYTLPEARELVNKRKKNKKL